MVAYETELTNTRRDVALLQSKTCRDGRNLSDRVRLAYRQYHLASLTEAESDYQSVQTTLDVLVRDFGPQEDVCLLRATVEGRFHRLEKVREALKACPLLVRRHSGRAMLADVDFQEGRYQQAGAVFSELVEQNGTWDALARLAHWTGKMGDADRADQLYEEAEEGLTAKEMRSFAWLELQRGALALCRGRLADARMRYERASTAFPGHWRTDEHVAALLIAEGDLPSAESLMRRAVTRSPRPEAKQALGELLAMIGKADEAYQWLHAAATAFLSSVEEGGVHYFHHLADLYSDGLNQPAEAIRWARKDVSLRSNFDTQSGLAWALFKNGEYAEGLEWIRLAVSSGARDRSMFAVAAALFHAIGDCGQSEYYKRAARAINPNEPALHLHH